MPTATDRELLETEFQARKESIAALLRDATRNYPPAKEDVSKILTELSQLFPELKDLKRMWKEKPERKGVSLFWWNKMSILDLNRVIEKEANLKPYNYRRARDVFAHLLWLCYELLFKEDFTRTDEKGYSVQYEDVKRRIRSEKIIEGILFANVKFKERTSSNDVQVFREDVPSFFARLPTRCKGRDDFSERIQSLASIFEVDLKPLRDIVPGLGLDASAGSIGIIQRWLSEKEIPNHEEVIDVWKKIRRLRNAPPAHPELSPKILEAAEFFGEKAPFSWTRLWDSVLNKFAESLERFQGML